MNHDIRLKLFNQKHENRILKLNLFFQLIFSLHYLFISVYLIFFYLQNHYTFFLILVIFLLHIKEFFRPMELINQQLKLFFIHLSLLLFCTTFILLKTYLHSFFQIYHKRGLLFYSHFNKIVIIIHCLIEQGNFLIFFVFYYYFNGSLYIQYFIYTKVLFFFNFHFFCLF